jgi:RNA polymerase sigma-70 factor (ECF subfamily)
LYNRTTLNDQEEIHELVAGVCAGDRQAFLALYDAFSSRVYGLAMYMLREHMAAEDVTQETFLKLWTRADTFQPGRGRFVTWLLAIARRTALDRLRKDSRRPQMTSLDSDPAQASQMPEPTSLSSDARWRTIPMALDDLPDEQMQVIRLAFYFGLSQSQIAETLDVPLGTVKTRIRLGMDKLRLALHPGDGYANGA